MGKIRLLSGKASETRVFADHFNDFSKSLTITNIINIASDRPPKACLPKVETGFGVKETRKQIDKACQVNANERDIL